MRKGAQNSSNFTGIQTGDFLRRLTEANLHAKRARSLMDSSLWLELGSCSREHLLAFTVCKTLAILLAVYGFGRRLWAFSTGQFGQILPP
ncbi:hypothetical protein SUGI_1098010 [Cryptomeria japonica]|nr:hypothetical protein SUGI_1098010 [Cryptomeria japonica]